MQLVIPYSLTSCTDCRINVTVFDSVLGEVGRNFMLHLPASYDPSNSLATPLVLDFPPYMTGAAWEMSSKYWKQVADQDDDGDVLAIAPL